MRSKFIKNAPSTITDKSIVATRCQAVGVARKTSTVWRRVVTCLTCPTCLTCLTSQQARLPFSRWREKGPGDEGGDRAAATFNALGTAVPCYDGVLYVAIRCQAVGVTRKTSTVWRRVATLVLIEGQLRVVATRCQAVEVARKTPTVWRRVATLVVIEG